MKEKEVKKVQMNSLYGKFGGSPGVGKTFTKEEFNERKEMIVLGMILHIVSEDYPDLIETEEFQSLDEIWEGGYIDSDNITEVRMNAGKLLEAINSREEEE